MKIWLSMTNWCPSIFLLICTNFMNNCSKSSGVPKIEKKIRSYIYISTSMHVNLFERVLYCIVLYMFCLDMFILVHVMLPGWKMKKKVIIVVGCQWTWLMKLCGGDEVMGLDVGNYKVIFLDIWWCHIHSMSGIE